MKTTQTWVKFLFPGAFFSEDSSEKVSSRDISELVIPEGAFAFSFHDVTTQVAKLEDGTEIPHKTGQENKSGMFYPGGIKLGSMDVGYLHGDNRILLDNMRSNGWKHVVKTRVGNFQPFDDSIDTILP